MLRFVFATLCLIVFAGAAYVRSDIWKEGVTFSDYLSERNVSTRALLEGVSKDDIKFLSEIRSGVRYYEMYDDNGTLEQALVSLSDEMQIHLYRSKEGYRFDLEPIVYRNELFFADVNVSQNPYDDTLTTTRYPALAKRLSHAIRHIDVTRRLRKGDKIAFVYRQRLRMGHLYGIPSILSAKMTHGKDAFYIYVDEEGEGYTRAEKKISYTTTGKRKIVYTKRVYDAKGKRFGMPLRRPRVTSSFSYRRWHPILHRYRPHHGTDFGARRGTPILAVNDGKVIFAGWMRGYGKTVKIKHGGGYVSLYAHQSRIRVKRGQYVKRGQIIGYVGSTGRSTGPHLHLGLMKNGRWIDPMRVLGKKRIGGSRIKRFTEYRNVERKRYKIVEIKDAQKHREVLDGFILRNAPSERWNDERFEHRLYDEVRWDED